MDAAKFHKTFRAGGDYDKLIDDKNKNTELRNYLVC